MTQIITRFVSFLFLLFLQVASGSIFAAQEDPLSILRKCAERLDWSRNVFVSPETPAEDFKVFGISDIPFSELSTTREKSYIQWLTSDHRWPLEKVLDQHLESYRKIGFQISPIEGGGIRAYHAYLLSYIAKGPKGLELSQSSDIVEILTEGRLLTVGDERLNLGADAGVLLGKIYDLGFKGRPPKSQLQISQFQDLPQRIELLDLFPNQTDLASYPGGGDRAQWLISDVDFEGKRGEIPEVGIKYQRLNLSATEDEKVSDSTVTIFLSAHGSRAKAKYIFERQSERLKSKPLRNRSVFLQDIFISDIRVKCKGASLDERKKLLEAFASTLRRKINKVFNSTSDARQTTGNDF